MTRDARFDEAEIVIKSAIAEDLKSIFDEDYVVLDYVVVAKVLDSEGEQETQLSMSNTASLSDLLGWLRYGEVIIETKLANSVTRRDRGE